MRRRPRAEKNKIMGRAMNPYEAYLANGAARVGAWVRGVLRRYRRPLLIVIAATATIGVGVSAGQGPEPQLALASR